ncbi:MAG: hypothetical protein WCR26_03275 [Sphaerochaetaceae bacterium]
MNVSSKIFSILNALANDIENPTPEVEAIKILAENKRKVFKLIPELKLEIFKDCIDNHLDELRDLCKSETTALRICLGDTEELTNSIDIAHEMEVSRICKLELSKDEYLEALLTDTLYLIIWSELHDIPLSIGTATVLPKVVDIMDDYIANTGYFQNWAESPNQDGGIDKGLYQNSND